MGLLTRSYQLVCLQFLLLHSVSCAKLCSHDQSSALLHFKQHFTHDNIVFMNDRCYTAGMLPFPSKLDKWKKDTDCCTWDGVTCDKVTGHVIELDLSCSWFASSSLANSSLFLLSHLQKLNLAFNHFDGSQIPSDFVRLKSLTHLNLSFSRFSGSIPLEISHLRKLVSLDLSVLIEQPSQLYDPLTQSFETFGLLTLETSVLKGLVQNMTDLEELVLTGVDMSTIDPAHLANLSASLTLLNLQGCGLQGMFPENIFQLPNIQEVNLRRNEALTGYLAMVNWSSTLRYLDLSSTSPSGKLPYSIVNLTSLWHLDLTYCNFMGAIPESIGNLSQLLYLGLSNNKFSGHIPLSLSNLKQLSILALSRNQLSGHIPSSLSNLEQLSVLDLSSNQLCGQIPNSFGTGLQNLAYINLHYNSLDGTIPSRLFTLPFLAYMDLSNNQLTGPIAEFQKTALVTINLSNNRLHGPIPHSIVELVNLTHVHLFSNNLSGTVELSMFAKLRNLEELHLSDNHVSLLTTTKKVNFSFPQLYDLALSSCNINVFPDILSTANNLRYLDISDNKIYGQVPNWLYKINFLSYLNLSHNYLTNIEQLPSYLKFLDLHSNLLQGQLPAPPPFVRFFSVSHNNMTGAIPSSFCNLSVIQYLDLSNNSFHGVIPQCLGNFLTILVLDLKMNNFHGNIPHTFANGSNLITLNLNRNQLEGPLPLSLVNCGNLKVLDLGSNMINDTFPHWLATLSQLQVLILKSNRFHGPLVNSMTRIPFSNLRIVDISHNGFTGHLRIRFFKNFQAMMRGKNNSAKTRYMGDLYYKDSVIVTMKGLEFEMHKILTIFTAMDLSCNKFQGQIPEIVGKLNSLKVLNFSHNNLTGHIPIFLENLTELESLDLSSNELKGEIPKQLTSLTFLSVLNLSYNQLEGPIPLGKQFNTFENNSYIGNLGLCGLPLSKKCINDTAPESKPTKFQGEQNTSSWFDWKIIMMGYGSGLVIGLSIGYIVFSTRKPWWFVSMVERKVLKLTGRHKS